MKNLPFFLLLTVSLLSLTYSCKERCGYCPTHKVCEDGECVLLEECFELSNVGVCYSDLYLGVAKGTTCFDTLIFNGVNTSDAAHPSYIYFEKMGTSVPHRVLQVSRTLGENEYQMWDITPICGRDGHTWYFSKVLCKIFPGDSVRMSIYFQADNRDANQPFIDSTKLTLYSKKHLPH